MPASKIVAGEWSGKNQERWSPEELDRVIRDYLKVFSEKGIISYYQILGSQHDLSGLWNFRSNTPNRGAQAFMEFSRSGEFKGGRTSLIP